MKTDGLLQMAILRPPVAGESPVFIVDANSEKAVLQVPDALVELDLMDGVFASKQTYNLKHLTNAIIVSGSSKLLVVYIIDDFDDLSAYTLDLDSGNIAPLVDSGNVTVFTRFRFAVSGETLVWISTEKSIGSLPGITQHAVARCKRSQSHGVETMGYTRRRKDSANSTLARQLAQTRCCALFAPQVI